MIKRQSGFTIIELIISMSLGAVVSAAAMTLYITAQKTHVTQESLNSNQVAVDRGLSFIAGQVKKAGHAKQNGYKTSFKSNAAIINSAVNYGDGVTIDGAYISGSGTGPSFMDSPSDQMVIMYKLNHVGGSSAVTNYDCEGKAITGVATSVVERYFVRESDNGKDLALACDAGRFTGSSITGLGGNGVQLIPNVDMFHVMYTIADSGSGANQKFRDVTIDQYRALTEANARKIVAVKLGLITHGQQPIGYEGRVNMTSGFKLFNKTAKFNASTQAASDKNLYSVNTLTVSLADGSAKME